MKKRNDYDEMEKDLEEAHEESKARKEGTSQYGSIFKDDLEVPKWRCKNGEHVIDIIPYRAGKFDPNRPEGKAAYFLDIYIHKNIGSGNDRYVCPSKNYKKPCPICEEIKRQADNDVPYDDYKSDVAKRQNVYNIVCYDENEEDKGVQVWDIANFFMEDKLRGLARNKRTGEPIYYASPKREIGRSISFERKGKKSMDGQTKVEFLSHEFLKRDYEISKDILESAVCLDEIIIQSTYEEIYEAYWGESCTKENKENHNRKKRRGGDDDDDDIEKELRNKKHHDDDEKPKLKHSKHHNDDEDDTNNDEEDSKKKNKKKNEDLVCPSKEGEFGVDCDTLAKCKKCDIWDECAKAYDDLESEGKSDKKKSRSKKDEDDDEITIEDLEDMSSKEMKKLIEEKDLDVDPDDCDDKEELKKEIAKELGLLKKKSKKNDDD